MPKQGVSRFIPLLVIVALVVALGVVYGPGVVRTWKFRSTINSMLREIRAGNLKAVPGYVVTDQQPFITIAMNLPPTKKYVDRLDSLKLSSYHSEEDHIWAIVTAGVEGNKGQGQLRWEWDGKQWKWDVRDSYYRFGVLGDQTWQSLPELMELGTTGGDVGGGIE